MHTRPPRALIRGVYYTDVQLWLTARRLRAIGKSLPVGSFHPNLAAWTFGFFAFEAFVNEMGSRLDPDVFRTKETERAFFKTRGETGSSLQKFGYLSEITGHNYRIDRGPYQAVLALAAIRDFLAHARSEEYAVTTKAKFADMTSLKHQAEMLKWGDGQFTDEALKNIEALADDFMKAVKASPDHEHLVVDRYSAFDGVSGESSIGLVK
jgi:hypothetical protein